MPAPVKPSDFKRAVVEPGDTLAVAILKTFVILPYLRYKLVKWMFDSDGNISYEFAQMICSIQCNQTSATTT